jgi:hypothetical protein
VDNIRFSKVPQAGRCATCRAVFDPGLEQGGNTTLVVRRDSASGNTTRVLVHRWSREPLPAAVAPGARFLWAIVQGSQRGGSRCAMLMVACSGRLDEAGFRGRIDDRRLESAMSIKGGLRRQRPRADTAVTIALPSLGPSRPWREKKLIGSSDLRVGVPDGLARRTPTAQGADVPSPRAMAAMRAPEGIPPAASTATASTDQCTGP